MELSDFCLKRLFNPGNFEFLPNEEQINFYKQRDLSRTKNYSTVLRIWGQPKSRRRVIIAPPMSNVSGREKMGRQPVKYLQPLDVKPKHEDQVLSGKEEADKHQQDLEERTDTFHVWLKDRKQLRTSIEHMGLNEQWLRGKDKTPLEQRVYTTMRNNRIALTDTRKKKEETSSEEEVIPKVQRPMSEAMGILASYIASKRERIIDLFSRADKDKSWTITREEFRKCIKEAKIVMSPQLLDDLIQSLDQDKNSLIDYRELAHAMKEHQIGKRKSGMVNSAKTSERIPSATSSTSSPCSRSESVLLEVPPVDITEQVKLEPDVLLEKRKRERHIMKSKRKSSRGGQVRTNIARIDQHCYKSTLEGDEMGQNIDRFREARLKEYYQVLKLCDKYDLTLSPMLLQKALLFPGDKPHRIAKTKIKAGPSNLFSSHFADPPEKVKPPVKHVDSDKIRVSVTGEMLIDARHAYPLQDDVKREKQLMNLSSGKAFVSRKVDCWMTFEEYDHLTRDFPKRYISMNQEKDPGIFWPGHLLDKLRIYLPEYQRETQSIYSSTHQSKRSNPGYHNDLLTWPINDKGYVKVGDIELVKSYSLHGK